MRSDVTIREANAVDAGRICEVWRECLQLGGYATVPCPADAIGAFLQRIENVQGHSRIWIAEAGDECAGWQGLLDFGATQITRCALSSTYISPLWQRRKIGHQLLQHAMQYAADGDLEYILGWIRSDNIPSINLVLSLGWQLVGRVLRCRDTAPELSYYSYAIPRP